MTKLSGRTVPLDLIDIVTVGGVRLAAAQACNIPGRARLISSLGIIAQDDAAPIQTLGDVATIVLTDDSWDLSSFTCCFGATSHHPVPEVLDFLSNCFPTHEIFRAVEIPNTAMSWEEFLATYPDKLFKPYVPFPHQADATWAPGPTRVADLIWDMCTFDDYLLHTPGCYFGLPLDEDAQAIEAWLRSKQISDRVRIELTKLLPVMQRGRTFANVVFPDALEPVLSRKTFADQPMRHRGGEYRMEICSTRSYCWCMGRCQRRHHWSTNEAGWRMAGMESGSIFRHTTSKTLSMKSITWFNG